MTPGKNGNRKKWHHANFGKNITLVIVFFLYSYFKKLKSTFENNKLWIIINQGCG